MRLKAAASAALLGLAAMAGGGAATGADDAAGKTAWEVGTILGISERTVRFHLNAAREKLQCTTTTQAVARAVSEQLFVI